MLQYNTAEPLIQLVGTFVPESSFLRKQGKMVLTGIETTALVLAISPVLISTAQHYRDGLQPLKEWGLCPREVDPLSWDLKGQLFVSRHLRSSTTLPGEG